MLDRVASRMIQRSLASLYLIPTHKDYIAFIAAYKGATPAH